MTCELRDRKPSEVCAKRSVRSRTQHRQVWFAHVVLFALIGSSLSANNIQMTENVATTILSLQPGKLNFMATLKRTGSSNVGTFVYHEFAAPSTTNVQKLRFFDSEPLAGYVHNYELTVGSAGQMFRGICSPSQNRLAYNKSLTGNSVDIFANIYLAYNTGTSAFSVSSFDHSGLPANGRYLPLKSDDLVPRAAYLQTLVSFISYIPSPTYQADKTISAAESSNFEYIDQVSQIGNYALYMHRSGLLVW